MIGDVEGYDDEPGWFWRNCRDIGFSVHVWPLTWGVGWEKQGDVYGVDYRLNVGPVLFQMSANIGNADRSRFALDEHTAFNRALGFKARKSFGKRARFK